MELLELYALVLACFPLPFELQHSITLFQSPEINMSHLYHIGISL